jgi:hypothetical protein
MILDLATVSPEYVLNVHRAGLSYSSVPYRFTHQCQSLSYMIYKPLGVPRTVPTWYSNAYLLQAYISN